MFFCVLAFFCEPPFTSTKTIDKPSMSMVSHKPSIQWQWFICKKNIGKIIDTNGSIVKKPFKNHRLQCFFLAKAITIPSWSKFYHRSGLYPKIPDIPGNTRKKKRYPEIPDRIFRHSYPTRTRPATRYFV